MSNVRPHKPTMRRQSIIYSAYAVLGIALFVYLVTVCVTAWERFGPSGTFALACSLAALFAALAAFNAWVACLFKRRAVAAIHRGEAGALLIPEGASFAAPVSVNHVRVIRQFGEQFSRSESVPKFTLIQAANKYWVTRVAVEVNAQQVTSEA
jgi:hypothetical protein